MSTRIINAQHEQSIILSLQKADGSCCSVWACGIVDERVAAKPYDDGELAVICTTNGVENEQGWKSVQFLSTVVCKLFM